MKLPDNPEILIMGHPLLFQEQPQVSLEELEQEDFQHNLRVLRQSQLTANGIGIAAPQIGWAARVLSLGISEESRKRYPQAPDIGFAFWINPQFTDYSQKTCWTWEGCLSVPGMRAWVERPEWVEVCGYNEKGERLQLRMEGFHARVMQHEMDHLNGILYPQRLQDKEQLIPDIAIEYQEQWADNWPSPGARITPRGKMSATR